MIITSMSGTFVRYYDLGMLPCLRYVSKLQTGGEQVAKSLEQNWRRLVNYMIEQSVRSRGGIPTLLGSASDIF